MMQNTGKQPARLPDFDSFETLSVHGIRTPTKVYKGTTEVVKVDRAFSSALRQSEELANLISKFDSAKVSYCVFGGWIRDTLAVDVPARDIDLVVTNVVLEDLLAEFPYQTRSTIFGGISSSSGSIPFDIWPLQDTFLIRKLSLPANHDSLLRTADFNINSALYFPSQRSDPPLILDGGMIKSLKERVIRFNSHCLVSPIVQAARLAAYAAKLGFEFDKYTHRFVRDIVKDNEKRRQVVEGLHVFQSKPVAARAVDIVLSLSED